MSKITSISHSIFISPADCTYIRAHKGLGAGTRTRKWIQLIMQIFTTSRATLTLASSALISILEEYKHLSYININ